MRLFQSVLTRLLLASLLAALAVGLGLAGTLVLSSPEPLSVALEPLCLILLPGILVALLVAGAHDFSAEIVVLAAAVFYAALAYWWVGRWMRFPVGQGDGR